jgi:succinate dehydrogenase / fumarate reductase cytochrome b subunit
MTSSGSALKSALFLKIVMAVTGLVLFGFVLSHMAGNLKLYLPVYADGPHAGQHPIDVYGHWLREIGTPALPHGAALWIARIGLLVAAVLHIGSALAVSRRSALARPEGYQVKKTIQADYAARTMRWGGFIILFYVVYHLAHLTWGGAHSSFQPGEVHHNLVAGFSLWWVSAIYLVANLTLGFHLYHGLWSFFQTLGWAHPNFNPARRVFAAVFATVVTLGNVSFPLAVLAGWVK